VRGTEIEPADRMSVQTTGRARPGCTFVHYSNSASSYRVNELRNLFMATQPLWTLAVYFLFLIYTQSVGARDSVVGGGTRLQTGRSRVPIPMRLSFFDLPNPSSRTMALGSTQPLTEVSARNLPEGYRMAGA
jgi:hypothetical protein